MANAGVSVVIPVDHPGVWPQVRAWHRGMQQWRPPHELLLVVAAAEEHNPPQLPAELAGATDVRVISAGQPGGVGAALRIALPHVQQPFVLLVTPDYPYQPADFARLWDRIHIPDEWLGKPSDLVNGCRTGEPPPLVWRGVYRLWRGFWRVWAGLPMRPLPPWYGWRYAWLRWRCRWLYGIPLEDVLSGMKLFRTAFLRRFPIQSDGMFVHVELAAKATFLTSIVDEVPLSPAAIRPAVPAEHELRADCRQLRRSPRFCWPEANGGSSKPVVATVDSAPSP